LRTTLTRYQWDQITPTRCNNKPAVCRRARTLVPLGCRGGVSPSPCGIWYCRSSGRGPFLWCGPRRGAPVAPGPPEHLHHVEQVPGVPADHEHHVLHVHVPRCRLCPLVADGIFIEISPVAESAVRGKVREAAQAVKRGGRPQRRGDQAAQAADPAIQGETTSATNPAVPRPMSSTITTTTSASTAKDFHRRC
jgi:hypothetical protein